MIEKCWICDGRGSIVKRLPHTPDRRMTDAQFMPVKCKDCEGARFVEREE